MSIKTKRVEHAELGGLDRLEADSHAREGEAISMRLLQADIEALSFLWGQLESRVGLASNMGAQLERLQQLAKRELVKTAGGRPKRPRSPRKRSVQTQALLEHIATPAELLAQRAAAAFAQLPAHVQESLAPDELPVVKAKSKPRRELRWNGVLVAKGVKEQTIHVKASSDSGCLRMVPCDDPVTRQPGLVTALFKCEQWVDPKNRKQARDVATARRALVWMVNEGDGDLVAALFAMYSGSLPQVAEWKLVIGDLWPLVLDTPAVLHRAERMTRELRLNGREDLGAQSWTVTPRTAAQDLLARRSQESPDRRDDRERHESTIKTQATRLLIQASGAYRRAKEKTRMTGAELRKALEKTTSPEAWDRQVAEAPREVVRAALPWMTDEQYEAIRRSRRGLS